jgi:DMSO/TMAO reductase YedYZ molybdopterin-dependent catalytic subunit
MRSLFRPPTPPDPGILDNHGTLIRQLGRRGVIRGNLSLGALTLLTGCNVSSNASIAAALTAMRDFNDDVQGWLFDPNKLAPTYPASMVLKPPRFNAYYDITKVRPVDPATWKLEVSGLVSDRTPWTIQRVAALPQTDMVIRHVCVEGWDYIGEWSGPTLRTFLERVGADTRARYVAFRTADDYPSSIDMATALHPQTLLATAYAGKTLDDPFGFPLRLRMSTKLGYKSAKWITAIEVTNTYPGGFWEKRGYSWFGGI